MEIGNIIPHIEALIFASEKPLTSMEITELINNAFGFMEEKLTLEQIQTSIDGIIEKYASEFYPFEVRESGGGWQFLTKKDYHKTVAQLNGEKFLKRLSSAALETLAIIAYKQPITKGEIESIRGVSSDYSIQKLLEKELIVISGRNDNMPGKPLVYSTSKTFMDYFGINSPADLPKLKEVFAETLVEPTIVGALADAAESGAAEGDSPLHVSEEGELQEGAGSGIPPYSDSDESLAPEYPDTAQSEEADEQADESESDNELAEAEQAETQIESGAEGPDETQGESDEEGDADANAAGGDADANAAEEDADANAAGEDADANAAEEDADANAAGEDSSSPDEADPHP
jgi:segregation and condensation protein B